MATGQGIRDRLAQAKAKDDGEEQKPAAPRPAAPAPPEYKSRRSLLFIELGDSIAILDVNASPLEFIASRGEMETSLDDEGMSGVRFHTALRIRDLADGAQIKGVRSPSLEGAGGGGGGASVNIPGYRLDCMGHLQRIRRAAGAGWISRLVEDVVVAGVWFNLRPAEDDPTAQADRSITLQALHYGLDVAGVTLGYVAGLSFRARWPDGPPPPPAFLTRRVRREDMVPAISRRRGPAR